MYCWVVRGISCDGFGVSPTRLYEQVDLLAVLLLQALHADLMWCPPGPLDAPICGPHQSDGNPTIDISARPRVGLPPLCCEATGYPFQGSRRPQTHQPDDGGNEGREVSELLEACLQVNIPIRPLRLLQTLFRFLCWMVLCICVHDAHVVNTVSPIMPEVTDQEVTLLFCGL